MDGAADGAADVALGGVRVVEEAYFQGGRVLAHVNGLDIGVSGPVPHIEAASVAPWEGRAEAGSEGMLRGARSQADVLWVR